VKKKETRLTERNRFKVEGASHTVSPPCLAWACIRLDRLQRGYRFVRLYNKRGCPIEGGKLLIKVDKVLY
jgi:phosphatidylinositol phospholipase C delta